MRRHPLLATGLLLLIFAAIVWQTPLTNAATSLRPYVRIASQITLILRGKPDVAFESEYPPLIGAAFYLFHQNPFGLSFIAAWKLHLVLAVLFACAAVFFFDRRQAPLAAFSVLLTTLLLGPALLVGRYDLLIFLWLLLCWRALEGKWHAAAGAFLGLAAGLKLVPILAAPFVAVSVPPENRTRFLLGLAAGCVLSIAIPLVVIGPDLTWQNISLLLSYHGARGLQLESTWGGLLLLWSLAAGIRPTIDFGHGAYELSSFAQASSIATIVTLLGLAAFFAFLVVRRRRLSPFAAIALPLLWACAAGPVLSPQYLLWLVPLLLLRALQTWPPHGLFFGLTAVSALLTQAVFPLLYNDLIAFSTLPILLLNLRNLGLVGLTALVKREG